jgi:hypothetical protein
LSLFPLSALPLFLSSLFEAAPALPLSSSVDEGFVVVVLEEVLLELPLLAGEPEEEEVAGLDALLGLDELPLDFVAAGLEVVVDEELVAGVAVADDFAGETLVDGVVGGTVAVAVAVGVAVAVAVAVGAAVALAVAVAVGVAVAIGVAVALAAGGAVGAVCPATPVCVVTPLRPPLPRLMLIPAAGCTP